LARGVSSEQEKARLGTERKLYSKYIEHHPQGERLCEAFHAACRPSGKIYALLGFHHFAAPACRGGRLLANVFQEFKRIKRKQAELKLQLGQVYNDQGYVFCWEDGRLVDPGYLSKHFKKIISQCGYEGVTFHSLRHSYASALLAMGEHPKVVQELLGHAQISMTLDTYSHVAPEIKERAAAKIDNFLKMKKTFQESEG